MNYKTFTKTNYKHNLVTTLLLLVLTISGCIQDNAPESIELTKDWHFSPDTQNIGSTKKWFTIDFDDSEWKILQAGDKWENQGFKELDDLAWYRKKVKVPKSWKGKKVWLKFEAVNDAYELYINGESVSYFGAANISVASRPTFTEISEKLKFGEENQIALCVNDWGGSGGLWVAPVVLTTNEADVSNIFKPMSDKQYTAENLGYKLFWEDNFDGTTLDLNKWAPRGIGPRAAGYVSNDAINVKDGKLELAAFVENDSIKVGAVGTNGLFATTYGFFECRAQLQKSAGNWSAFWIQSPGIAKGEDPGKYGTEIDIFEFFKKSGEDMVSHNLHWAYGPNQQSISARLSHHEGVSEGFHTFALEWTPEKYAFFIDGYKYYEINQAISHTDEYLILSMELPSTLDGMKNANLPDVYIIDYVKVYKK